MEGILGSTGSHVEGRNVKHNWIQHEEKVTVLFYLRSATPAKAATGSLREGGGSRGNSERRVVLVGWPPLHRPLTLQHRDGGLSADPGGDRV